MKKTHRSHIRASSSATTSLEASNVSWVVVDALDRNVGCSELGIESCNEGWTDETSDIPVFKCASCKDQREFFARKTAGDIVPSCAGKVDVALYCAISYK